MKTTTLIKRIKMKEKILNAMTPLIHQIILPYDKDKTTEVYDTFFKELDKILNLKWEEK